MPRADASMFLLATLVESAPEPAYADKAATRREGVASDRRTWRYAGATALGMLAVGAVLALSLAESRAGVPVAAQQRQQLADRIAAATARTDAEQARLAALRADVARQRDEAVAATGSEAAAASGAELAALELSTGAVAVRGPGIVVTVDDAPAARSEDGGGDGAAGPDRVLDTDLQRVVNGLWAAGAEAVSINGQRLTSTTAIRSAGEAVLVAFRPLSPPYEVSALGDPEQLQPAFRRGPGGQWLSTLARTLQIGFDVRVAAELALPGASTVRLDRASAPPGGGEGLS